MTVFKFKICHNFPFSAETALINYWIDLLKNLVKFNWLDGLPLNDDDSSSEDDLSSGPGDGYEIRWVQSNNNWCQKTILYDSLGIRES